MKRNILFFIVLWMSCCCAMAQSTITLKFTGKNQNNDWIPLSRVLVEDQTQRWQEMLYYPDTTLFAGTVGIEDHAQDVPVQLFQNVPNPFNGVTNFSLQLNEAQKVQLEIYDVDGKMMAQYQDFLPQGVHVFRANLTTPQTYLLSARTQDGIVHIKMVNTGRGGKNSIEYVGADGAMAWKLEEGTKGASPYPFQKGDRMKYVGYATLNGDEFVSEPIDKVQSNSETIPLTFTLPLPVVTTSDVISVTGNGAVSGGNVTSDGGATVTARGVCWSTSQSPTVSNNHTSDGTGTGGFTSNITGLAAGTSYYVRAYATTVMGTAYGAQKSFVTLTIPTVTTAAVSSITSTTAVSGGNVTSDGGAMVTTKGVCWSTNPNPTLLDSHTTDNPGSGNFTSTLTGLSAGTTYYVRAYATNSEGTAYGDQVIFTTANVPTVTTTAISSITSTTAVSGGNVTSDGGATVTARGVCWSTSQNPTVNNSHTTNGTGTGSFTSNMTGLSAGTTYYVRAYATNSEGTAYGAQVSFTTAAVTPTVTTTAVNTITSTTAKSGGNVTSDGGATVTARGVCWSTSQNPTVNNSHTTNGTGTGSFTSNMTGLSAGTTYYVRAYATNSEGTAYGDQVIFTTANVPTVTTTAISSITSTTAVSGGNVTSDGGATVTARGVCWSTNQNPTVSDSHTTNGTGTGSFTSNMTGLSASTTYYVRAYATNSVGTAYGNEISFTTESPFVCGTSKVSDYDGNLYNTIVAGTQCWTKENMKTTHYSDGASIPLGTSSSSSTGYRYYPNNNSSNVVNYGYLYNWPATVRGTSFSSTTPSGVQGICPTGWHVPSAAEWNTLVDYVTSQSSYRCNGSYWNVAKALASNTGWSSSSTTCAVGNNQSSNNSTGFSVVPAGDYRGNAIDFGTHALFWTTSNYYNYGYPTVRDFNYSEPTVIEGYNHPEDGNSVRCVRDEDDGGSTPVEPAVVVPTVTTTTATQVGQTTAVSGGNVTSDGGATVTARGVCWSTSQNPTVSDSHTTNGTGTGSFTSNMTGLSESTTYYVRAYATNSSGTAYGNQVSFTTAAVTPTVTTTAVNTITSTTAKTGGNVTSDGGATVTARGVCWSTSQNPTVNNSHTTNGTGTGSFTSNMTGLSANTTYYVRAYATNSSGTAYGNQVSFTTEAGCGTVTDYDGNVYNTVQIGNQCWMKQNLKATHYSDGTSISLGSTSTTSSTTAYRYYPNNSSSNVATYGYLYNWPAVMHGTSSSSSNPSGVQGICPTGWHVPSDAEWTQLTDYVSSQSAYRCDGSSSNIAKALASTTGWRSSTTTCAVGNTPSNNNATGFSAVPAGGYYSDGYGNFGDYAHFWSATHYVNCAYSRNLDYHYTYVHSNNYTDRGRGCSVRCLRDESGSTASIPTVTTTAISSITSTTAVSGGNVTSDGGATVTARGVCWSTSQNPTVSDSHTTNGTETGSFTSNMTGLSAGTTYYVRAYATNSVGTAYGSQISFTTSAASVVGAPCVGAETVTDHEGNVYNTVQIGEQCWTRENMRCSTSPSTGTSILEYPASSCSYSGKKAYYVNGNANNTTEYGLLYNWNAAVDTFNVQYGETSTNTSSSTAPAVTFSGNRRGICPQGWHVPSDEEWTTLTTYVGSQSHFVCGGDHAYIAKALASTVGWDRYTGTSSTGDCYPGYVPSSNNATGFSAVPAGSSYCGGYSNFGYGASFWSATQGSSACDYAIGRYMSDRLAGFGVDPNTKFSGYVVRCLRD